LHHYLDAGLSFVDEFTLSRSKRDPVVGRGFSFADETENKHWVFIFGNLHFIIKSAQPTFEK
jgi:hypothetical protein